MGFGSLGLGVTNNNNNNNNNKNNEKWDWVLGEVDRENGQNLGWEIKFLTLIQFPQTGKEL